MRWLHIPLMALWIAAAVVAWRAGAAERLYSRSQYDKANLAQREETLRRAVARNPFDAAAQAHLGETRLLAGDLEEARKRTELAMRLRATLGGAKQLASVYFAQKDWTRLIRTLNGMLAFQPGDPDALFRLAYVRIGQKQYEEARRLALRCLALNDPAPEMYYLLSQALQGLKEYRKAMHCMERFLLMGMGEVIEKAVRESDWAAYMRSWDAHLRKVELGLMNPLDATHY
ncbi:MAG: Tetratricopeptide repeat protein [candidate division BRC1 bacterium ADurb.BinA364]|nr:MAG: Tetratricopeptide repeat protein [candidate division BRC1 bacterium ADurb.BinA364]